MNHLVKITRNEDGDLIDSPKWCLVESFNDAQRTVCTGEVFGFGEGFAEFQEKHTKRGGITCDRCLEQIKWYKKINI